MYGDSPFPRVFLNVSALGNELPTYEFVSTHERSFQLRYDYDFAALGVPGLLATTRYVTGDNVKTKSGYEGKDWERDLDISYTFQATPLKGLGIRVRNAMARSNYRTDIINNIASLRAHHIAAAGEPALGNSIPRSFRRVKTSCSIMRFPGVEYAKARDFRALAKLTVPTSF